MDKIINIDRYRHDVSVLAFHHVFTEQELHSRLTPIKEMEVEVSRLEQFILRCLNDGIRFVSIDEVLRADESARLGNCMVLTVDDGYIDVIEVLYPLIERYAIPACVYIVTGYPDGQCLHNYRILEDYVSETENIEFELFGSVYRYRANTTEEKLNALKELNHLVDMNTNGVAESRKIFECFGIDPRYLDKCRTLSWSQIIDLNCSELVTIGSHTVTHPRLTRMGKELAYAELLHSKQRLQEVLNEEVRHFSYPYGDFNDEIKRLVSAAGYATATTIKPGHFSSIDMYAIQRFWLNSDLDIVTV
jgi:peptidoglycan/xylan/chitin deacetylase (PgdA/CDA1 family)